MRCCLFTGEGPSNSTSFVEYIWEAKGSTSVAPGKVISPVFMLWVTVFFMYLVNCLADSVAVQTMQVQHVSQLRRQTSTAALRKSGSSRVWYEEKVKPAEVGSKPGLSLSSKVIAPVNIMT